MFRVQDPVPFVRVYEGHGNRRAQVLMDRFMLVCGTSGPLAVLLNDRAQQVAAGKGVQALVERQMASVRRILGEALTATGWSDSRLEVQASYGGH